MLLSFQDDHENTVCFHAVFNEDAFVEALYCDPVVYGLFGVEFCLSYDIALAMGGSEAIVESFYSVMGSQSKAGGQNNETLALR